MISNNAKNNFGQGETKNVFLTYGITLYYWSKTEDPCDIVSSFQQVPKIRVIGKQKVW